MELEPPQSRRRQRRRRIRCPPPVRRNDPAGVGQITSMSSGQDLISALPDGVLQRVLGFLPADESVKTSVLARRWRHIWKSMLCLRFDFYDKWDNVGRFNEYVNLLLLQRDPGLAIDEFQINGYPFFDDENIYINAWIGHALLNQTQVVALHHLTAQGPPLVSQHLKKVKLMDIHLERWFLDFASCPSLEDLDITDCRLDTDIISSQSLKHLSIKCTYFCSDIRTRIYAPNVVLLSPLCFLGKAPLLEPMPSLETAFVRLNLSDECLGSSANLSGDNNQQNGGCVLLGGLSNATNLELLADPRMLIFKRDLQWCPMFSKLKILLLNEWCVTTDLSALVCILDHSPVLEKLTLQLSKAPELPVESQGSFHPIEKLPAISEHLNIVEIICREADARVCKIWNFLSSSVKQVNIKRDRKSSRYFSCE